MKKLSLAFRLGVAGEAEGETWCVVFPDLRQDFPSPKRGHQVLTLRGTTSNHILPGKVQTVPQSRSPTSHALPSAPSPRRAPRQPPQHLWIMREAATAKLFAYTPLRPPWTPNVQRRRTTGIITLWLLFLISHMTSTSSFSLPRPVLSIKEPLSQPLLVPRVCVLKEPTEFCSVPATLEPAALQIFPQKSGQTYKSCRRLCGQFLRNTT